MKDKIKALVTGGTGFVGVHTIIQLLELGYTVNTTMRSISRKSELTGALQQSGITDLSRLHFFEADLLSDEGWAAAIDGCHYVLHVASPFTASEPEDENELILPAKEGTLRVLRGSRDAGVKRVVITSSFAAIGYSKDGQGHIFDEQDWTDPQANIPAYIKSKTVAELAAWDFIKTQGGNLELTVINPVGIFGPVVGGISSASLDSVVAGILNGDVKESPAFTMGVVDVRDVADIHIKAMVSPAAAGERFLATAPGVMSFADVALLIRKERPEVSAKIVDMANTDAAHYISLSNRKAVEVLHWHPRSKEEAILASVDSLVRL